jgi:hypothetical protein
MTRILVSVAVGLVFLSAIGCKRDRDSGNGAGTSSFLDNATPEAREALAIQVDYKLTDANFAQWEIAQRNLDRLPSSAFPARQVSRGGNVIDRAVARLESSPKARTTIEATGLTVRDFVLQTIALAQATEAVQGGRPAGAGIVPPENFRFVERHRDRIGRAQLAARNASRRARSADIEADAQQIDTDTAGTAETMAELSDSAATVPRPVPQVVQPPVPDSARSRDDGEGQQPQRDTTGDSVYVDRGQA